MFSPFQSVPDKTNWAVNMSGKQTSVFLLSTMFARACGLREPAQLHGDLGQDDRSDQEDQRQEGGGGIEEPIPIFPSPESLISIVIFACDEFRPVSVGKQMFLLGKLFLFVGKLFLSIGKLFLSIGKLFFSIGKLFFSVGNMSCL